MRTALYVDGFNLYHSALESRPEMKWLDLQAFAKAGLLPEHEIVAVKYFTARVRGKGNSDGPQRQDTYVRALEQHIQPFEVHWGKFTERPKWRRIVDPPTCLNPPVQHALIHHREEKGSDVSLAAHLVNDAWRDLYDCAAIITNDTDQCGALKIVKSLGKKLVLLSTVNLAKSMPDALNEAKRSVPKSLADCVDHVRYFSVKHLSSAQLPERVPHRTNGKYYTRPLRWNV